MAEEIAMKKKEADSKKKKAEKLQQDLLFNEAKISNNSSSVLGLDIGFELATCDVSSEE
jgi:hypothetical protein